METRKEEETRHETVVRQSARRVRDRKTEDPEQNQDESLLHKKQDKKKDAVQVKILKKEPVPEYDTSNLSFPVVTVSVSEIKKALKTKSVSENSKRQLVLVPNVNERSRIYAETAIAVADREAAALPSHGGRNWTCNIVISDAGGSSGEGVNSNHGSIEQGRRSSSASSAFESSRSRGGGGQKRKKKDLGPLFRWYRGKLELACLPHLLDKIDILDDGTSTINNSTDPLVSYKKTDMQERQVSSMSTWAWENTSYPAPILKRKWLSPDHVIFNSRTSALQHAAELLRRDKLIDRVLFGFGHRGVELRPVKPTRKDSLEAGYYRFLRDGLWVIGQEEDWLEDRLHKWNSTVTSNMEVETMIENDTTMLVPPTTADTDGALIVDDIDGKMGPINTVDDLSRTKNMDSTTSLDSTESNHNAAKLESSVEVEAKFENDASMLVLPPSSIDGAFIVNDTDGQMGPINTVDDFAKPKQMDSTTTLDSTESNHNAAKLDSESSFLSSQQKLVHDNIPHLSSSTSNFATHENSASIHPISAEESSCENNIDATLDCHKVVPNHIHDMDSFTKAVNTNVESYLRNVDDGVLMISPLESGSEHSSTKGDVLPPIEKERKESIDVSNSFPLAFKREDSCDKDHAPSTSFVSDVVPSTNAPSNHDDTKPRRAKTRTIKSIAPSNHWRLSANEIDSCTDAINDFFQRVMYTIKMKQLHSELADGFDIIRERGRGRYDMQIPSFDDGKFDFLTNLETARWMPVIRQILGNDATLVHKGSFLSLPGSDAQVYHQDGPHLTTKYQRPCHAVNVFIPLVDLHDKNGPTEFCVGTHILGYEYYTKELVYTPTVKAGTPIIFDYRLGHRGLGNSSDIPRPIVYLTYTSASKEFRDQINFSTKRYKKFGEILDLPVSREERARKRNKVSDDIKVEIQCSANAN